MKKRSLEYLVLCIVLLIAAFLRFYRLEAYLTFLGDEGRDVLQVKRIIIDHKLTLLGPTASVGGFFLGPLYYYMILPFLWLFKMNPVGPAVMVALIGVVTVWLVWRVGKDFFDTKTGLLAAGLYAISPLVIHHSRSSWNPNVMPFFSLLTIYATWWVVVRKRWRWLALVGFLLGLTFQIHYLATFLLVAVGIYLLFFAPLRQHWQHYLAAGAGFVVGWSPFLIFELRHRFPNFISFYNFFVHGEETGFAPGQFLPTVMDVGFRLFERLVTDGQSLLAGMVILVSFWFFRRVWQTHALLTIWLLVGIGLFGFYQESIYDYYFGFMFPLPFFLSAYGLIQLAKKSRLAKAVVFVLLAVLIWVSYQGMFFHRAPNHQLDQTQKVTRSIIEHSQGRPFNFALITGQNSDHAYRYFLELWGYSPVAIENSDHDPERKTVADQLIVVCEVEDCQPLGHPLWEIAGFGRAEIVEQWQVSVLTLYKLKHFDRHAYWLPSTREPLLQLDF